MQSEYAVLDGHVWSVWLLNIFPHYLIEVTIFGGEKILNTKCVL
jgi:hypothetical protein